MQPDFEGIKGPVVTDFYYLDAKNTAAISEERSFKARFADVSPASREVSGLRQDGRRFVGWFTPDPNAPKQFGGTVEINGAPIKAALTGSKSTVNIREPATAEALQDGLFTTRIYGDVIGDRFMLSRLDLYPEEDPRKTDDPNLPRVLVVGDSISMNYQDAAKAAL